MVNLTLAAHSLYLANSLVQAGACYYKKTSVDAFQKISEKNSSLRRCLLFANVASIFWGAIQCANCLRKDASFLRRFVDAGAYGLLFWSYSSLITEPINYWMTCRSPIANKDSPPARQIRWCHPLSKKWNQTLFLTQLISSIVLIVRSPLSNFFKINAAIQAYSLYMATTEYWLGVKKIVPINNPQWLFFKTLGLRLHFPMIPKPPESNDDSCHMCLDQVDFFYFDQFHPLCPPCTADYLSALRDLPLADTDLTWSNEDSFLKLTIQKNNPLICPTCRQGSPLVSENLEAWVGGENDSNRRKVGIDIIEEVS